MQQRQLAELAAGPELTDQGVVLAGRPLFADVCRQCPLPLASLPPLIESPCREA
jgi:hypothetical protein